MSGTEHEHEHPTEDHLVENHGVEEHASTIHDHKTVIPQDNPEDLNQSDVNNSRQLPDTDNNDSSDNEYHATTGEAVHNVHAEDGITQAGTSHTTYDTVYGDGPMPGQPTPPPATENVIAPPHNKPTPTPVVVTPATTATSLGDASGAPVPTTHPLTSFRETAGKLMEMMSSIDHTVESKLAKLDLQKAVTRIEALYEGSR